MFGAVGFILGLVSVKMGKMMIDDVLPSQKAAYSAYFSDSRYLIQAFEGFVVFYAVSFFIILVIRMIKK